MLNKSGLFSPLFSPLMTKGVAGRGVVSGGVAPVPNLPILSRIVFGGDSNYQGSFGASLIHYAIQHAKGMAIPIRFANQAVAGYKTANVLANINALTGLTGDICSLNVGRNDLYDITGPGGGSTGKETIVANAKSRILSIWSTLLDGGFTYKRVGHNTLIERPVNGTSWTQDMEDARLELNAWLLLQHGTFGGRVSIADLSNTGFNYSTDSMPDGQHVNYAGAFKLSRPVGLAIRQMMGDDPYYKDPADFGSIVSSASRALAGNSGTVIAPATGQVAAGCTLRPVLADPTGITITASKEAGTDKQIIDFEALPTAGGGTIRFFIPCPTGSYYAGYKAFPIVRAEIENSENIERIFAIPNVSASNSTATGPETSGQGPSFSGAGLTGNIDGELGLCCTVANQANARSWMWIMVQVTFLAGGAKARLKLSKPTMIPDGRIPYP